MGKKYKNRKSVMDAVVRGMDAVKDIANPISVPKVSLYGSVQPSVDLGIKTCEAPVKKEVTPVVRDAVSNTTRSKNMAISLSKYVDIKSSFPSDGLTQRSFGGLVFTVTEMLPETTTSEEKTAYDAGEPVSLTLSGVLLHFGANSDEYKFATRYYGYVSPTGNVPCALKFAKVKTQTIAAYDATKTYNVGDYAKHTDGGTEKTYKCIVDITTPKAWDATDWEEVTGAVYETASAALTRVDESSNQFGSFTFLDTTAHAFPEAELQAVSVTNSGFGVRYLFIVNDIRGTQATSAVVLKKDAYKDATGTCFVSGADNCSGVMPMAILAALNYETGSATNFMFKQFTNETPSVKGDTEYEAFKTANVNFYGRTQSNGQSIDFYQRGFNTDGTETAIYCNEMWFKATCATDLIQVLLANERVPANAQGVQIVEGIILDVCASAATSGAFMPKTVSTTSATQIRNLIATVGGTVEDASTIISEITANGYSVYAYLENASGEYLIHYFVFYGTADSVRFIKGDDIMVK